MIYIVAPIAVTFVIAARNYQIEKGFTYNFFDCTFTALFASSMTSIGIWATHYN